MSPRAYCTITLWALALQLSRASDPFQFCSDNKCSNCPVQVTDAGTGFPNCVIYSTNDVFGGQPEFNGSSGGGIAPFINVPQPAEGCEIIVKSPAATTRQGCGYPVGKYEHAACGSLQLDTTFMVQFCCGTDDCKGAGGLKRSAKFDSQHLSSRSGSGGGGLHLYTPDGNMIEPLFEGPPPEVVGAPKEKKAAKPVRHATGPIAADPSNIPSKRSNSNFDQCPSAARQKKRDLAASPVLSNRDCSPDDGSWVASGADYTRPADNTSIVLTASGVGSGGGQLTIDSSRSQTWTSSTDFSFGFAKVISLGVDFSQQYSCEVTDTQSRSWTFLPGQSGVVGFTAYLNCQQGTYTCGGTRSNTVEFCAPYYMDDGKTIAGIYAYIAED